ncbi:MAG TPA: PAS domain-containing protein [Candidatus Cybelea sp.]|nr:PAS domain-containing protein [Candidatus Cybelea sp.]
MGAPVDVARDDATQAGDPMDQREQIRSKIVLSGHDYWQSKRQGRRMPSRADLDPPLEVPQLVPSIILLDVLREPLDFRYRLIGTKVRGYLMRDLTGRRMSEIDFQRPPSTIWSHQEWVVENREPRFMQPPYVGPHRDFMFIDAVILPLGADPATVDMLMVFVDFATRR